MLILIVEHGQLMWHDHDDVTVYKLSIHIDAHEPSHPLQLTHHPQIQGSESIKVAKAIKVFILLLGWAL